MKTLALVLSLFALSPVWAQETHRLFFMSDTDQIILVEYQTKSHDRDCYKCSSTTTVENLTVSLEGGDLSPSDRVSIVVTNIPIGRANRIKKYEMRMTGQQDATFYAILPSFPIAVTGYANAQPYRQEFTVFVNGRTLTRRGSVSDAFHMDLFKSASQ